MANLYQGSIYSRLAVLYPPPSPSGFKDLINWDNWPVVAKDINFIDANGSRHSVLLKFILPQLLQSNDKNLKFA